MIHPPNTTTTGKCAVCGAPFKQNRKGGGRRKYCGRTCANRASWKAAKRRNNAPTGHYSGPTELNLFTDDWEAAADARSCRECGIVLYPSMRAATSDGYLGDRYAFIFHLCEHGGLCPQCDARARRAKNDNAS